MTIVQITSCIILMPLLGAILAGIFGKSLGVTATHRITIFLMFISFSLACVLGKWFLLDGAATVNQNVYTWLTTGAYQFNVGYMIDGLTAVMLLVVTFVSLLVHIYSIGYMHDDPGYQRFFCYMSLFTFAMLTLVTANNFLQLFFGWEGVGLVSYLLIGFWFTKDSANAGSLKAFVVNRVGDFGFLLGIGAILAYAGTLDYAKFFHTLPSLVGTTITILPDHPWQVLTVIALCLFVGAMGKSAQIPLHVWLPESMEGPTPISALIHAATMVTAGIYMVARMSPLFQLSPTALSTVLIIGATGALFTGLIGIVQNDIKRVVAYSTLSQLGYMVAALGASAYTAGIFHLATHACFKALLFLAAGSVILGLHHEQDMRKMGGLWRMMPITYITFVIGSLALCALPPFSGFFSKDAIIEAVHHANIYGAHYAYDCVLVGSFVTALYTFRALFMTFHGKPRFDAHHHPAHESPWVVTLPLILLAIPSVVLGYILVEPMLYHSPSLLGANVITLPQHESLSAIDLIKESIESPTLYLVLAGIIVAWLSYVVKPSIPHTATKIFGIPYRILVNKYGFDEFNQLVFIRGGKALGKFFYRIGDTLIIDNFFVIGSSRVVTWLAALGKKIQTGYIYNYIFIMVASCVVFLGWIIWH